MSCNETPLADRDWRCWRLWYQGPPGARGLYIYRDRLQSRRWGVRRLAEGLLIFWPNHHLWWAWRYHR